LKIAPPDSAGLYALKELLKLSVLDRVRAEALQIQWTKPRWIEPCWLGLIAALGLESRQCGQSLTTLEPEETCYAERMGLFEHLGVFDGPKGNRNNPRDQFFPLERILHGDLIEDQARRATDCLQLEGKEIRDAFFVSLVELMDNAIEHSECGWGGIACAQAYAPAAGGPRRTQLVVADAGIGIRRHLERGLRLEIGSDEEAVSMAIRPQVSGARRSGALGGDGPSHAGMGLPQIVEIVKEIKGNLLLCSGRGMVWVKAGALVMEKCGGWPGTIAVMDIFPERILDFSRERILDRLRAYQGGHEPPLRFT
jgi:hypothetical protein